MRILLLILLLISHPSAAKKLYKYQDANGHWHYTDQKPDEGQDYESRQLKADPKRHVWLEKTGEPNRPSFSIRNTYKGPVEVEIKFTKHTNATATPSLPHRFVVEPGDSGPLFTVSGIDVYKPWQFTLQYSYTLGSPLAEHRADAVYYPPIANGGRFLITQSFGGPFSHQDEQNRYAVDIAMPIGTPIHAARGGVIMDVEDDFYKNGIEQSYKSRANSVRILHADGSMAVYAHLALEKAQVYPGLKVEAGQLIAYSGNTGYSSGPHLHFAVQVNKGMRLSAVPFMFVDDQGQRFTPQAGVWLQKGQPRFGAISYR